jgi:ribosome-interacting GTPase 1
VPANLTPDYLSAEQTYKKAGTQAERIHALEQMLATVPKHKGTEKLVADIRRRLSQERKESQKKGGSHAAPFWLIHREGAGQVALLGPPNCGKSSLVRALTHAHPEVGDYPFTTRAPLPGMMAFEDVQIQLIDMPPLSQEFMEPWMAQAVKHADLTVLMVDPNDPDVLGEIEFALGTLEGWRLGRPALLVGNKVDVPGGAANFDAVVALYGDSLRCVPVSARTGEGGREFAKAVFEALGVVRFYSKPPGKPPDLSKPYVLKRGETVRDAAAHVHRDIAEHLKYARLFHRDGQHDGMMVERSHLVEDGDILEFHA